jgi:hypothetical protein
MKENVPITDPIEMVDPNWMQKTGGYAKDMTLRDHFAGLAITGISLHDVPSEEAMRLIVNDAYRLADAMLKAREAK